MSIVVRIVALTALSVLGVALLAPLATSTIATDELPPAVEEALLPVAADAPLPDAQRGSLSERTAAAADMPRVAERLRTVPLPTPASAPMEATIAIVPTPSPTPAPAPPAPPPPAPPPPAPAPSAAPQSASYSGDSVWDDLARCESGGNWIINTGNGYYGGLQFSYGTWHAYGGGEFAEYPHQATRAEQITVAERLRADQGYAPWPACRVKLGLP